MRRLFRLCSDLIGLYVSRDLNQHPQDAEGVTGSLDRRAQVDLVHAHDTPANRRFLRVSGPVTSSIRSSVASRSAEIYGEGRTERLAGKERQPEGEAPPRHDVEVQGRVSGSLGPLSLSPPAALFRRGALVRGVW
jgi:hypothetical protein